MTIKVNIYTPNSPSVIKKIAANLQATTKNSENLVKIKNLWSKDINGNYYVNGGIYLDNNFSNNLLSLVR